MFRAITVPKERPFKVYNFVAADSFGSKGNPFPAFWAETCACQDECEANTIRNLLQRALPGIRYVVSKEPPAVPDEIPQREEAK